MPSARPLNLGDSRKVYITWAKDRPAYDFLFLHPIFILRSLFYSKRSLFYNNKYTYID